MEEKNKDKLIVSMPDLERFLDLLMEYGQTRDHISINNSAFEIKAFLFGEDPWLKEDLKAWAEGMIEYKQNEL